MKDVITVTGHVNVSDVTAALEPLLSEETLKRVDDELDKRRDERIGLDDCEVFVEGALDALDDAGKLPEPENPWLEERDVMGLAEAIRCGDREHAELLLDRPFADLPNAYELREWIDRGRFSRKAREAVRRPAEPQRKAA